MNSIDPSGHKSKEWTYKEKNVKILGKKNVKLIAKGKELRVCTDGKVSDQMEASNYYGDKDHDEKNTTSCFGKYVAADEIPYIVVPPSKKAYKFSSGVIINRSNGDYLYCVVGEVGKEAKGMGEVSIYAAWIMDGLNPPKSKREVTEDHMIGNSGSEESWKILLFKKSCPNPKKKNKKYGWKYKKQKKLYDQIIEIGEQYYTGKGKCLN